MSNFVFKNHSTLLGTVSPLKSPWGDGGFSKRRRGSKLKNGHSDHSGQLIEITRMSKIDIIIYVKNASQIMF